MAVDFLTPLRSLKGLLPDQAAIVAEYLWHFRRLPRLSAPRTFSEKVNHRKLYDRDPRLVSFSDKVEAKRLVAEILGEAWIIPTLWHGTDPSAIPFAALEPPYVVKASHGSGRTILVRDREELAPERIVAAAKRWMARDFGRFHREWAYSQIEPRILIEPFIGEHGAAPADYKFFVFAGRAHFVEVRLDRFEPGGGTCTYFDAAWRRQPFTTPPLPAADHAIPPPPSLAEMVAAAERLGGLFSFARVDLYDVAGTPRFGEVTFYPAAGLDRFSPPEYDRVLGDLWP